MCPVCLSTLTLIAAGAGSVGGLAAVVVRRVHKKPAAQAPSDDASGHAATKRRGMR
jgi:hypothetical protein